MEEAISTYSDYLQMCQEQNYDMKSSQVLFPKHCNEAHDELSRYIKKCRDEQTKRAFREVYEHLAEKANLTSKKLQIVCPKQTDDLYRRRTGFCTTVSAPILSEWQRKMSDRVCPPRGRTKKAVCDRGGAQW